MPTSCQPINRCGTHIANWINGGHPSIADGLVRKDGVFPLDIRLLSVISNHQCKVRNCGSYYVYYLNSIPTCYGRYCGTYLKKKGAKRVLHVQFRFTQSGFISFLYYYTRINSPILRLL